MRKRDEPAFPVTTDVIQFGSGMTKLEYTAIQIHAARFGADTFQTSEDSVEEANYLWDELEGDSK